MHTYSYSQIWKIAFPVLISTLMEQLIGMTDTAFLGRIGEVELGASALGGIFFVTIFMLGLGFSIGAQILMGRRNGEGNYLQIGNIFYHSLAFLLCMALVLFVLTRYASPILLKGIISSHRVYEATNSYLHWRIYGFFFAFVNVMFRAFYVATTQTRTLTFNSVVMVLSNVVFNYALIFGHFGLPALGIAGAAIGSTLAEGVSTLFFVLYTRWNLPCEKFGLNRFPKVQLSLLRSIFSLSVWTMIQNFISLTTWFIFFLCIEHLGEQSLAATNIIRNISAFTFMAVIALASTASTLVSNLLGQGDADAVWPLLRRVVKMGYVLLIPILLLIGLFPNVVMSIFTNDVSLMQAGHNALYVWIASYLFTIPAQIFFNAVSGTGNTKRAFFIEFSTLVIYTLYVIIAIYHFRLSLSWCWFSEFIYSGIAFVLCYGYMRSGKWKEKKI